MERILITGANGFIGSHLIDFLVNKNFNIYALDLPGSQFKNLGQYVIENYNFSKDERLNIFGKDIQIPTHKNNLKIIECDLINKELLEKIILEFKPKYVFHFAAQPYIIPSWNNPIETIETNVIGTIHIFESIKKHKIDSRVVVACSAAEFGTTANIGRPLKETDSLMAIHPYGISKIAAELLSRQY